MVVKVQKYVQGIYAILQFTSGPRSPADPWPILNPFNTFFCLGFDPLYAKRVEKSGQRLDKSIQSSEKVIKKKQDEYPSG